MVNVSVIFFVTETEYPKLQAACPIDFPFTYAQFVERVEEGIRHMPEDVPIKKINIDITEFLAWCRESKANPDNKTRAKYALLLHARTVNPNAHL